MAASKTEATDALPLPIPPPKTGKGGMLVMVLLAVLLSTGISGGLAFWLSSRNAPTPAEGAEDAEAAKEEPKAPAGYLSLSPAFVVNLEDDEAMRFLQVEIEVMSRDPAALEAAKTHLPQIRGSLLLLLGQQRAHALATREAKEKLQADVLADVQRILQAETGSPGIEAVYFTSFVMQ